MNTYNGFGHFWVTSFFISKCTFISSIEIIYNICSPHSIRNIIIDQPLQHDHMENDCWFS